MRNNQEYMQEKPLFSIIVLCYKNTDLFDGMLDSILQQDYPNIELIISDDGTPDFNCEEVEAQIRNKIEMQHIGNITRLCVRKNEQNMRTVRHVAKVLPMAVGHYVVFTAADDRFVDDHVISTYVQHFEQNPQNKWLVGKVALTSGDYKKTYYTLPTDQDKPYFEARDPKLLFGRWSRRSMGIPCHMAFCKDAFELAGGIDLSYTFSEDWPLVLHLLLNGYAPIYVDKLVALHSTGGITNSNARYGVETRRAFYNDKYHMLDTITEKNLHLLSEEDKKAYRQYRHEIMDRNYFLNIDMVTKSKVELIGMGLRRPECMFWLLEILYWKLDPVLKKKKMLVLSQLLLVCSALLFDYAATEGTLHNIFGFLAWMDFFGAIACILLAFSTAVFKRILIKKNALRKSLVN